MRKRQIIDVTGTSLTPSRQGKRCLGNGENPQYECCDECDYYLYCFPQYDFESKLNKLKKWLNKHKDRFSILKSVLVFLNFT